MPHIVAAKRLTELAVFGFLPGLLLEPSEGLGPIEVDLFSIKDGRVMVGECKASGCELTNQEADRLAVVAKALGCSRIIYATPTDFGDVASVIQRAKAISEPIHVEVWGKGDLRDRLYGPGCEQCSPTEYLEELAKALNSSAS